MQTDRLANNNIFAKSVTVSPLVDKQAYSSAPLLSHVVQEAQLVLG